VKRLGAWCIAPRPAPFRAARRRVTRARGAQIDARVARASFVAVRDTRRILEAIDTAEVQLRKKACPQPARRAGRAIRLVWGEGRGVSD
jgi:hypothetical protein